MLKFEIWCNFVHDSKVSSHLFVFDIVLCILILIFK